MSTARVRSLPSRLSATLMLSPATISRRKSCRVTYLLSVVS